MQCTWTGREVGAIIGFGGLVWGRTLMYAIDDARLEHRLNSCMARIQSVGVLRERLATHQNDGARMQRRAQCRTQDGEEVAREVWVVAEQQVSGGGCIVVQHTPAAETQT